MDAVKILGSLLSSGALSSGSGSNVLGNLLGSVLGGGGGQGGGGVAGMLGGLLGGGQQQGGGMANVLGGLLGGGQQQNGSSIGGMLGSMLGGQQQPQQNGGGMADMLGNLLGGSSGSPAGSSMGGLGNLLGGAVTKFAQSQNPNISEDLSANFLPQDYDRNEAEEQAKLIIRAMINAAKADGHIDEQEQEGIIAKLGDIDAEEAEFVRNEFNAPLDVDSFVRSVPKGMEQQIYVYRPE